MEVSLQPYQIDNIARMNENLSCVVEDSTIYEECSICYESFTNKSFINECLHPFCYKCIIDWTKVILNFLFVILCISCDLRFNFI